MLGKIRTFIQFHFNTKYVYLTFDDGPCGGSDFCINYCNENNISATFFLIGEHFVKFNRLRYLVNFDSNLLVFANHSFSHAYNENYTSYYKDHFGVIKDFEKNNSVINFRNKLCRLPGRNIWAIPEKSTKYKSLLKDTVSSLIDNNYLIYGWDFEFSTLQNTDFESSEILRELEFKLKRGYTYKKNKIVILLHDWTFAKNTMAQENFKQLIIKLSKKGYIFSSLLTY